MTGTTDSYVVGAFSWHVLALLVLYEGRLSANQCTVILTDHIYAIIKQIYPVGMSLPE